MFLSVSILEFIFFFLSSSISFLNIDSKCSRVLRSANQDLLLYVCLLSSSWGGRLFGSESGVCSLWGNSEWTVAQSDWKQMKTTSKDGLRLIFGPHGCKNVLLHSWTINIFTTVKFLKKILLNWVTTLMNVVKYWQQCSKPAAADSRILQLVLINKSPEAVRSSARTEMTNAGKIDEWLIRF